MPINSLTYFRDFSRGAISKAMTDGSRRVVVLLTDSILSRHGFTHYFCKAFPATKITGWTGLSSTPIGRFPQITLGPSITFLTNGAWATTVSSPGVNTNQPWAIGSTSLHWQTNGGTTPSTANAPSGTLGYSLIKGHASEMNAASQTISSFYHSGQDPISRAVANSLTVKIRALCWQGSDGDPNVSIHAKTYNVASGANVRVGTGVPTYAASGAWANVDVDVTPADLATSRLGVSFAVTDGVVTGSAKKLRLTAIGFDTMEADGVHIAHFGIGGWKLEYFENTANFLPSNWEVLSRLLPGTATDVIVHMEQNSSDSGAQHRARLDALATNVRAWCPNAVFHYWTSHETNKGSAHLDLCQAGYNWAGANDGVFLNLQRILGPASVLNSGMSQVYSASKLYYRGEIVIDSAGVAYTVLNNGVGGTAPASAPTNYLAAFVTTTSGFTAWSSGGTYTTGAVRSDAAKVYISRTAHTGRTGQPKDDPDYWRELVLLVGADYFEIPTSEKLQSDLTSGDDAVHPHYHGQRDLTRAIATAYGVMADIDGRLAPANKVKSDTTNLGEQGTLTLPATDAVDGGVQYGEDGTGSTGTGMTIATLQAELDARGLDSDMSDGVAIAAAQSTTAATQATEANATVSHATYGNEAIRGAIDESSGLDLTPAAVWGYSTRTLTAGEHIVTAPVQSDNLTIIKGDSYLNADGTAVTITKRTGATWPTNITGTITFTCTPTADTLRNDSGAVGFTCTGTVTNATGDSQSVRWDMTAAQTATLTDGTAAYDFDVQWGSGSSRWTLTRGTIDVLKQVTTS